MTAVRPGWLMLSAQLREGLAARLGEIVDAEVQTGGFTPGMAVRLRLANGKRVFCKGIAADHALAGKYRAEAITVGALPAAAPAPALQWSEEFAGWVVLAFEDIGGRHADLSCGSRDVARVVDTVAELAKVLTPSPLEAPRASVELGGLVHGWRVLAEDVPDDLGGWALRHLQALAELETAWLADADGDTLLHGDLREDNLLVDSLGAVWVVDWAQPCRGASWIDLVDLVPHLILAGHSPADAEQVVAATLGAGTVSPEAVTSYAAAFAGYWMRMSRSPAPPGVPLLRAHQARAGAAACEWVAFRTGWA